MNWKLRDIQFLVYVYMQMHLFAISLFFPALLVAKGDHEAETWIGLR